MRTTIVSTSKLKLFKIISLLIVDGVLIIFLIYTLTIFDEDQLFSKLYNIGMATFLIYIFTKSTLKLKNISYDESSIYYNRKGYEVQVPFEEIKNIEIKTLTGVYKVNLLQKSQEGETIHFKMSMWYPFNFKKQDEKVNELRDKIDKYKRSLQQNRHHELSSYSI